jgi:hypothetical protein
VLFDIAVSAEQHLKDTSDCFLLLPEVESLVVGNQFDDFRLDLFIPSDTLCLQLFLLRGI